VPSHRFLVPTGKAPCQKEAANRAEVAAPTGEDELGREHAAVVVAASHTPMKSPPPSPSDVNALTGPIKDHPLLCEAQQHYKRS